LEYLEKEKSKKERRWWFKILILEPEYDYQANKRKLWLTIAKNEIKLRTSSFRNKRKLFFIFSYSILILWAFIIAPLLFDSFMPTIAAQNVGIFKPVVALLIESFMMILFLIILMLPLNNVYNKDEKGIKESLVASPVLARDIFLGEFLGKLPLYTFAVLIFAPIVVGMINPIIDLTVIQYIVIYTCAFGLVYFANLIGSIISSWLEHKISKSESARDWGKALIMILTIVMVIMMYAVIFFINEILINPELKNWLSFYPSIWFSNIILHAIDPLLLNSYLLNIWFSIGLTLCIPLMVLYISYKKAHVFYSLEGISANSTSGTKQDSIFYSMLNKLAGRKFGGLLIVQMKRFVRKKANLARIAYVIGLVGFMAWFISTTMEDYEGMIFSSSMLIAIGGAVSSMMLGHLIFINSKDVIWVYKKSPRGIKGLVYSYLLNMLIISLFISLFITILHSFFANIKLVDALIFFSLFLVNMEISMLQSVGLQCMNPAFGEKESNMKSNTIISMLIMQPVLMMPVFLLIFINPHTLLMMRIVMIAPVFIFNIVVGTILLYIGMKKLNKIE